MELLTEKLVRKIHIEKNDAKFSSQNVDMDAENRWAVGLGKWVSGYWLTEGTICRKSDGEGRRSEQGAGRAGGTG